MDEEQRGPVATVAETDELADGEHRDRSVPKMAMAHEKCAQPSKKQGMTWKS